MPFSPAALSAIDGQLLQRWKKYNLPMSGRECVHPERRIGSGHGMYDITRRSGLEDTTMV